MPRLADGGETPKTRSQPKLRRAQTPQPDLEPELPPRYRRQPAIPTRPIEETPEYRRERRRVKGPAGTDEGITTGRGVWRELLEKQLRGGTGPYKLPNARIPGQYNANRVQSWEEREPGLSRQPNESLWDLHQRKARQWREEQPPATQPGGNERRLTALESNPVGMIQNALAQPGYWGQWLTRQIGAGTPNYGAAGGAAAGLSILDLIPMLAL